MQQYIELAKRKITITNIDCMGKGKAKAGPGVLE